MARNARGLLRPHAENALNRDQNLPQVMVPPRAPLAAYPPGNVNAAMLLRFPRSTLGCTQSPRTIRRVAREESSMFSSPQVLAVALLVLTSAFLPGGSAVAQSDSVWHVEQKLVGKGGKGKSENVSGIACVADVGFPRS